MRLDVTCPNLSRELLAEQLLEGLAVLGELLDTLVELVERHLVLEESPAELGLVVDKRDLRQRLALGSYSATFKLVAADVPRKSLT